MPDDGSVPRLWILLFVLLALGLMLFAVQFAGGSILAIPVAALGP